MTREEAIKTLQWYVDDAGISWEDFTEAFDMALNALRPVSREEVEKVRRGEWQVCFEEWQNHRVEGEQCSKCGFQNYGPSNLYNFCPKCGAPMTDEAVEMVIDRMEGMENG